MAAVQRCVSPSALCLLSLWCCAAPPQPRGAPRETTPLPRKPVATLAAAPTATRVVATTSGEVPTSEPDPKQRPLFERYTALAEKVPWVSLGALPTPITEAAELGKAIGVRQLLVKRDDLSSPDFGGSKVRKLEFLLGEAVANGHQGVVTTGGVASNQAAATAVFGSQLGLDVHLLLLPQRPSEVARMNLLVAARTGAHFELVTSQAEAEMRGMELAGERTMTHVPAGGSTPLGNLAFVNAALELDEQIVSGQLAEPDVIYIAMGTMGSAVGLTVGLHLAAREIDVVAVRASNPATSSEAKARAMIEEMVAFLRGLDPALASLQANHVRLRIDGAELGRGYGIETERGKRVSELMLETEGLELEPTYTAKALAALRRRGSELANSTVLLWNTAGPRIDVSDVDPELLPPELRRYAGSSP